ncbi:MAG TPA: cohesin domain-containing protein [Candidatus Nanoarchaeia archaeon]|nr:hypothetical protein [uncultured archaeon]
MRLKFKLSLTAILILGFAILAPKFSSVWASKLILNPPFSNVEEGKDLEVEIVLQSDGERVDGVDVSLMYDADYLELKELREGGFFGTYPIKQDESGKLKLTALAPKDGVEVFGDVVVANLIFEVLDSGQTKLSFDFEKGGTKESNAPLHGKAEDSLEGVVGGSYNVVATQENLEKARARKARGAPSPLIIFIPLMILIGVGLWYWWKKRKPKEDVYTPEPFPMDQPPKVG